MLIQFKKYGEKSPKLCYNICVPCLGLLGFTTRSTTIAGKDMPQYAIICHLTEMMNNVECSGFLTKFGISWYNFA